MSTICNENILLLYTICNKYYIKADYWGIKDNKGVSHEKFRWGMNGKTCSPSLHRENIFLI